MAARTRTSGGSTLGQGKHGRTLDGVGGPGDKDTLAAALAVAPRSPPWVVYTASGESAGHRPRAYIKRAMVAREMTAMVAAATESRQMVA